MAEVVSRRDFLKKSAGVAAAYWSFTQEFEPDWYKEKGVLNVPAPEGFGRIVEEHVEGIFRKRYAEKIERNYFFHGHMIFNDKQGDMYGSLGDALENAKYVLYHTDEIGRRWREKERELPFHEKTPRSIVGHRNGNIEPAIGLTTWPAFDYVDLPISGQRMHEFELYIQTGTIGREILIKSLSEMRGENLTSEPQNVMIKEKPFLLDSEFWITPSFYGPYKTYRESFDVKLKVKPGSVTGSR